MTDDKIPDMDDEQPICRACYDPECPDCGGIMRVNDERSPRALTGNSNAGKEVLGHSTTQVTEAALREGDAARSR